MSTMASLNVTKQVVETWSTIARAVRDHRHLVCLDGAVEGLVAALTPAAAGITDVLGPGVAAQGS